MEDRDDDSLSLLYVWGYPIVIAKRLRERMTSGPQSERSAAAPLNTFGHQQLLSDPSYRVGIAPNVDTLYSVAWLDLDSGPFVFEAPDFGARYYTFQFGYADTSSSVVGQRTHGGQLPRVIISRSPSATIGEVRLGGSRIEVLCASRYMMIAGRIMVDPTDVGDTDVVRGLQSELVLTQAEAESESESAEAVIAPVDLERPVGPSEGREFFQNLFQAVADVETSSIDAGVLDMLKSFGFPGSFDAEAKEPDSRLNEVVRAGHLAVKKGVSAVGTIRHGWMINYAGVDFGDDWWLRSAVAMAQVYINPAEEAMYPVLEVDGRGRALDGRHTYVLRFPQGQLPQVKYFWSLTMYHAEGFLVENPLGRYAIGDRSAQLRYETDGSLEIVIGYHEPSGPADNWLPAPAGGFRLMLRLYGPTQACLSGEWIPPAIDEVKVTAP